MRTVKYNPAFLSAEERRQRFGGRRDDLDEILRVLRENTTRAQNQHLVLLGPRGMGKTTLLLRAVDETAVDPELADAWFPIVAPEECYRVGSIGELWLELVLSLSRATGDPRHERAYDSLRNEYDSPSSAANDRRLADAARGYLLDFADTQQRRLVLVVENLQILLGEQLKEQDAWALRETLTGEPRIMLLGSALSAFDEITSPQSPLFEQFLLHALQPLETDACLDLWQRLTGESVPRQRMRAIEILTGGNPRLLVILGDFAGKLSLKELTDDLANLVDEHTDYLKMTTESLPALERKVFVTLAEIWDYASASEVASQARVDSNTASAQLSRLVNRGAATSRPRGRGKQYRVAERLYSIYHMMRRRGGAAARARAATEFMVAYYDTPDLVEHAGAIARQAMELDAEQRLVHLLIVDGLVKCRTLANNREELAAHLPGELAQLAETPDALRLLILRRLEGASSGSPLAVFPHDRRQLPATIRAAVDRLERAQAQGEYRDEAQALKDLASACRHAAARSPQRWSEPLVAASIGAAASLAATGREPEALEAADEAVRIAHAAAAHGGSGDFSAMYASSLEMRALVLKTSGRAVEANAAFAEALHGWMDFRERCGLESAVGVAASIFVIDDLIEVGREVEAGREVLACFDAVMKLGERANSASLLPFARQLERLGHRHHAVDVLHLELTILRAREANGGPSPALGVAECLAELIRLLADSQDKEQLEELHCELTSELAKVAEVGPKAIGWRLVSAALQSALAPFRRGAPDAAVEGLTRLVGVLRKVFATGSSAGRLGLQLALVLVSLHRHQRGEELLSKTAADEALALDPTSGNVRLVLGHLALLKGRMGAALEHLRASLSGTEDLRDAIAMVSRLTIAIAGSGLVTEALSSLRASPMAGQLEPLIVALATLAGEDVNAPAEIEEMASDIIERIRAESGKSHPDADSAPRPN